ncbi:hypothetical protein M0805_001990 [Coniferiporia weirii]|nr:hypothetical protein M0805_001990 [Coniferiporia weirii]
MLNLSSSRLSRSSSQTSSSTSSSLSSRLSPILGLRRSHKLDLKRQDSIASQSTLTSSSFSYAEDMDDDNVAWGPVSRKKSSS